MKYQISNYILLSAAIVTGYCLFDCEKGGNMRQSNTKYKRENTAFIYVRLSRDDNLDGDSYSISNQKKLLTKVAKEKGYTNIVVFCDDGISGVTMNRPDFNKMMEQLKLGKASALFVKDLSRLGRNYIEVGRLTDDLFPSFNIRLVAVSDAIDTEEGENELTPIRNLFNEWYSRDISKKRRMSNKVKGNSGIPLGPPPYGYIKDPENPLRWIIDIEAATIVRKIYSMAMNDIGLEEIAATLTFEKVLTPVEYAISKGIRKPGGKGKQKTDNPYYWGKTTIRKILSFQEYCGDVINFKSYSISYKNRKRHTNNPEDMLIFKDVHEPIIDRRTFEIIQQKSGNTRKRKNSDGEKNMFSGLLVCAECGSNLNYHYNHKNHDIKFFRCPGHDKGKRKICSATHYIRVDFLEQVVLGEIRRLTRFACHYEEEFVKAVSDYSKQMLSTQLEINQKQLNTCLEREHTIDQLFEKIYEDNALGKLSDERFKKLSSSYESEQQELLERINELRLIIDGLSVKVISSDNFIAAVKKYTRVKKLTARMLNELIDHIEVYHAEKINGIKTQRITIYYNCIGSIDIPEELSITMPKITMHTRQGVSISYQPNTA